MDDTTEAEGPAALFDVDELAAVQPSGPGRVERALIQALKAAASRGGLIEEDMGLIGGALAAARALDSADRIGGIKGGYLVAQAITPYREALHALRLPPALVPAEDPRQPAATDGAEGTDWLHAGFGTAE